MATKKIKPAKEQVKDLTKKERQELRKRLEEISKISNEELIDMVRQEPDGQLAVSVLLDALWPKFRDLFKIGMPAKGKGVSDAQYQKQLADYREWTKGIKNIAKYWYCAGMKHKQNHRDILKYLDPQNDADAPDEPKPEEKPAK